MDLWIEPYYLSKHFFIWLNLFFIHFYSIWSICYELLLSAPKIIIMMYMYMYIYILRSLIVLVNVITLIYWQHYLGRPTIFLCLFSLFESYHTIMHNWFKIFTIKFDLFNKTLFHSYFFGVHVLHRLILITFLSMKKVNQIQDNKNHI